MQTPSVRDGNVVASGQLVVYVEDYFDSLNGNDVATDLEGSVLADLRAAREETYSAAREIAAEAVSAGRSTATGAIRVRDDVSETLFIVPFSDVMGD